MSFDIVISIVQHVLMELWKQIPVVFGLAAGFTILTIFTSQHSTPGKVWWRNPGLMTDLSYALIHTVIGPYFKFPALVIAANILLMYDVPKDQIGAFITEGRGPLSTLPFWAQVAIYMVGTDFLCYWIHRIFHNATMWRYHEIHHSAKELDWTTAYRFHPVNTMLQPAAVTVLMMTLGIPPAVMLFTMPFDIVTAAWVHSNLKWDLGPLKYIVATPVFHRWHHGQPGDGGDMNFASTFSLWDYLFGTFYMPEGRLPQDFGTDDHHFPEGYFAQLIYPFKKKKPDETPAPVAVPAE